MSPLWFLIFLSSLTRGFIAITQTSLSKPTDWKNNITYNTTKPEWKLNCPAAWSMNMQQPITRWPDVAVVAEFAFWPNCDHGKYPLPRHLLDRDAPQLHCWLCGHSGSWCILLVNLTAFHHPLLIGYRKECLNQDVYGCDTQLLEVIHCPHTVYLPQSYYYYVSLLHWKGIDCQGRGGYLISNGFRSAKVLYHLPGNSLDMSGIQWANRLLNSHTCCLDDAMARLLHVFETLSKTDESCLN